MTAADFERWIDAAYFYMVSDYVVAVKQGKKLLNPAENIQKAVAKGQIGFKRKHVRC